jgi:4-carboxymuconolactone decarboxylase
MSDGRRDRLPVLEESSMTAEQRRVYELIASGPRAEVVGPLRVWLTSPAMAERAQALGQYARYDSVLPEHLSELAILVTARIWSSGFEWSHHAPIAEKAGIPPSAVGAIGRGERPEFEDPRMAAIFNYAVELQRDRRIGDAAHAAALEALGEQGVVDLVAICGYYALISMTINAFGVPDGDGPKLPAIDLPAAEMFQ